MGLISSDRWALRILICTPVSIARRFSTLKCVKTFLRNTVTSKRLSALAMLSIEKELISCIPDLFDKVIAALFAKKKDGSRRIKLIRKPVLFQQGLV